MSLSTQQIGQLEALLAELADERLSAEGRAQLAELLQNEPEARDHYIRFMALCGNLYDFAANSLSAAGDDDEIDGGTACPIPPGQRAARKPGDQRGNRSRWWPMLTVVAAVVAAFFVVLFATRWPFHRGGMGPTESLAVVARLEGSTGVVELIDGETALIAEDGQEVRYGQGIATKGEDAHVEIHFEDGTLLFMAGDTRIRFPPEDRDRVNVEFGNLTATVAPRPADRPLLLCTPEARLEVLGTRLSVARGERRTNVGVLEGAIRVTRLSDRRWLTLAGGQSAEISPQANLQPATIQAAPDHWSLDFEKGLPIGWQTGQLVFDELPEGSPAAVRAAPVKASGRIRFQIVTHNAWSDGLFTLHDDSWIHIRYRVEKPGTFLLYVVCRQHDFGQPIATLLTPGNLRQDKAGDWHTLTLPLNEFRRARAQDIVPLRGQLVAFSLVFDSPEQKPGLTIDRIWITRGQAAR